MYPLSFSPWCGLPDYLGICQFSFQRMRNLLPQFHSDYSSFAANHLKGYWLLGISCPPLSKLAVWRGWVIELHGTEHGLGLLCSSCAGELLLPSKGIVATVGSWAFTYSKVTSIQLCILVFELLLCHRHIKTSYLSSLI